MNINGKHYRTIWVEGDTLKIIDQTALPHEFAIKELHTVQDVCDAISHMWVRGAGLIGATAAYGAWISAKNMPKQGVTEYMDNALAKLLATRPTASNLAWAIRRQRRVLEQCDDPVAATFAEAERIADEDALFCKSIGLHGLEIIRRLAEKKHGEPVNILTHCNAGWLAFVDYGSAISPIYAAFDEGIPVHVWVDETRPRNQGASLTAWELGQHGVPHDLIADNAGGHLMQHGMVDMVITGADRVTRRGDAANKIGTYLKALAAKDNNIPFYIALPSSTFDFDLADGVKEIPIEERNADEVRVMCGKSAKGLEKVLICPEGTTARNWAFDVTPARLITGLITERGVCGASEEAICALYPEAKRS